MNQLQAMRVFTRVVDLSSFGMAAKQLGMSAAAVTRSVSMLETHLNMRLMNRSTRRLSLTEAGEAYVAGCRQVIEQLDLIEANLARGTPDPSGTIRIAAASTFAMTGLTPLLAAYRANNPAIGFVVSTSDNAIDLANDDIDVGFSVDRASRNPNVICRPLLAYKELAVASPAYLAQHGMPANLSQLSSHSLLAVSDGSTRSWEFSDDHGVYHVATGNTLHANHPATIRSAALSDMGIALLPAPLVKDDLAKGLLLPILGQYQISGSVLAVNVLYTSKQYRSTSVRSFIDFIVAQYRSPEPALAQGIAA